MKNALLVYSAEYAYCNIGDYIQSLAARQFLPSVDVHVCREMLDEYSGDEAKVILNGWFMHEPNHWPPSKLLQPLFVSFHINSVARVGMTTEQSLACLRRWAPIGCRDQGTARLLRNLGVDAYFSGCLTLTLGKSYKRTPGASVCFVDPYYETRRDPVGLCRHVWHLLSRHVSVRKIAIKMFGRVDLRSLLKSAAFYGSYSSLFSSEVLEEAVYLKQVLSQGDLSGDAAKFAYAEKLLSQYASAKFVVTSRIHCALPCLGIGTPVLYVEEEKQSETSSCRLEGLRELLHVVRSDGGRLTPETGTKRITSGSTFENKESWKALAAKLTAICEAFGSNEAAGMPVSRVT